MIQKLEVVRYPRGPGNYTTRSFNDPNWELVLKELESMDSFEKPILTLMKHVDIPDGDLMMVTGGTDVLHISISNSDACWIETFDPSGSDEIVDVWTSDQGFSCEQRFTWPLATAKHIIKHYFDTGEPHPQFEWK